MRNSELYAIGSFIMIAFAMLLIWDLGIWAWIGIFFALYSGACYGWHREALKKEKGTTTIRQNAILQARNTPNKKGYDGNHIVHQITIPKKIIKEIGWKKGDTITMHTFGKILKMEEKHDKN